MSSQTITVPITTCGAGDSFTITYGANAGATASATGTATFATDTREGSDRDPDWNRNPTDGDGAGRCIGWSGHHDCVAHRHCRRFFRKCPYLHVHRPLDGCLWTGGSKLTLAIPTGWTAPSTSSSNIGFATASGGTGCTLGTLAVSSQTITVPITTCGAGDSFTITYGANAGATAGSVGTATFTTSTQQGSSGLAAIASQPTVTVQAAASDGQGTMTVSPTTAVAGSSGNDLTFAFTAPATGAFGPGVRS